MSDFDFDELDKAVAGVTTSDVSEDVVASEQPSEESVYQESPPATEKVEAPRVVPAARRSSGRFMDVVHPSSDMRSRTSPAVLDSNPSQVEKPSFVPPVAKNETAAEETPEESVEPTEDGAVGEWSKQLETPFLADAKVEKRPLGGIGPEPTQALLDAPEEELKLEESDELLLEATTMPDPIDFAAQTAALDSEKEDTSTPPPAETQVAEEDAQEQSIEQLDELKTPETLTSPVLEVKTAEEPVGPTSISQQYTEQVATTNQESGAIFDTENYHKPLTPTPKKRSGAWTVILILLLVILGAGAGVAFYLFVLPML